MQSKSTCPFWANFFSLHRTTAWSCVAPTRKSSQVITGAFPNPVFTHSHYEIEQSTTALTVASTKHYWSGMRNPKALCWGFPTLTAVRQATPEGSQWTAGLYGILTPRSSLLTFSVWSLNHFHFTVAAGIDHEKDKEGGNFHQISGKKMSFIYLMF